MVSPWTSIILLPSVDGAVVAAFQTNVATAPRSDVAIATRSDVATATRIDVIHDVARSNVVDNVVAFVDPSSVASSDFFDHPPRHEVTSCTGE